MEKNDILQLRLIEYVDDGVYRIEMLSENGDFLNTNGRVLDVKLDDGRVIQGVNFDSEEYGRLMMIGRIESMPICNAIVAFHNAHIQGYRP